jgi:hypothetical protein
MAWSTFGVDGRSLLIEQTPDGGWVASCEGEPERRGEDLAETLLAAVGVSASGTRPAETHAAWVRWAEEHARHILDATRADGGGTPPRPTDR